MPLMGGQGLGQNWPNLGQGRAAPRGRMILPKWPIGRVSKKFVFRSGHAKIFLKALSHSIYHADRKYGLGFVIRPREDRENLKLPFYPYRIG